MARIISYVKELRKHGEGYYIKDLGDDYIIVSNEKKPYDSFILMKAESFADTLAMCNKGHEAKEIREALYAIEERMKALFREKRALKLKKKYR